MMFSSISASTSSYGRVQPSAIYHHFASKQALLAEAELRYDLTTRWSLMGFGSVGRATFRFERDIGGVMSDCLRLLSPAGTLLCVTNHKKTSQQASR